jgi:hypothetical protein
MRKVEYKDNWLSFHDLDNSASGNHQEKQAYNHPFLEFQTHLKSTPSSETSILTSTCFISPNLSLCAAGTGTALHAKPLFKK